MEKDYQSIKNFLEETNSFESFLESDSLVWIDHREYDEDIISYFNTKIGNKIGVNLQDNGKSYGEDIYLKYKGKSVMIPYEENMDRDTTIIWTNEIIKDDFSIRLFVEEKGYDAFGFCLLANDEWDLLEKEFGKTLLNKYFFKINLSNKMFSLEYDVVEYLILKKKNPNTPFFTLLSYLEISKKEQILNKRKNKGEIDLKNYFQQKKEIKAEKDRFANINSLIL